jgi:hypothetical protein
MNLWSLLLLLSFWQAPAGEGLPSTVQGRVIDFITQRPLVRATVQVRSVNGDVFLARDTAADGTFVFPNVLRGDYTIEASAAGYITNVYGERPDIKTPLGVQGPAVQTLRPGQSLSGVQIALTPGSVIYGRITDDRGELVVGATVQAMRTRYADGARQYLAAQTVTSDDLGGYRLFMLPPGEYRIRVMESSFTRSTFPWYFPGTADSSEAQAIQIQAGQTIGGIDLTSFPTRGRRVSGTLQAAGFMPSVRLVSKNGEIEMSKEIDATGGFTFVGIPPGSYLLSSQADDLKAILPIDVRNADISNARLALAPGFQIPTRVRIEGPGDRDDPEVEKLYFTIRTSPTIPGLNNDLYSPFPNGRLTLTLVPGEYRLDLTRMEDMYVKSMRLGDANVLADGLKVPPSTDAPLEILVGTNPGSVQGRVSGAGATLVLVPERSRRNERALYKVAKPGNSGEFNFQKVPPGDYKLFAWREENGGPWLDPEYLRIYEDRATPLHVEPGKPTIISGPVPVF